MSWNVESFEERDLKTIAAFFKSQNLSDPAYGTEDFFRWKVFKNYKDRGIVHAIQTEGEVASTASVTPKELYLNHTAVRAAEIGDTYTGEKFQRRGMFSAVVNATRSKALEQGIRFIYGTPNLNSLPGYLKNAAFKVMTPLRLRTLSLRLNPRDLFETFLPSALAGILASWFLHARILLLKLPLKARNLVAGGRAYSVRKEAGVPQELEDFWNQVRPEYDFIFSRSVSALTWRFYSGLNTYQLITARRGDAIVGYIVYRVISAKSAPSLMIADYLFLEKAGSALGHCLDFLLSEARTIQARNIGVWSLEGSSFYDGFIKAGFASRSEIPVICFDDEFSQKIGDSCKRFHFTVSDSDNI